MGTMHVLSILTLASMALAAPSLTRRAEPAALYTPRLSTQAIAGKYIVKMKSSAEVSITATTYKAHHTYGSKSFKGFAATLDAEALEAVRNHPDVSYWPWPSEARFNKLFAGRICRTRPAY